MSDRRRGGDLLVFSPVRLPQSIPRVLQLAGNEDLPPGGVNRPTTPRSKSLRSLAVLRALGKQESREGRREEPVCSRSNCLNRQATQATYLGRHWTMRVKILEEEADACESFFAESAP